MPLYPGPSLPPRATALQKAEHDAAFQAWADRERARMAAQRTAFRANLGPARAALQRVMLDRAWDLLDAGECEAADALLEFVPEAEAAALLDEFFKDDA